MYFTPPGPTCPRILNGDNNVTRADTGFQRLSRLPRLPPTGCASRPTARSSSRCLPKSFAFARTATVVERASRRMHGRTYKKRVSPRAGSSTTPVLLASECARNFRCHTATITARKGTIRTPLKAAPAVLTSKRRLHARSNATAQQPRRSQTFTSTGITSTATLSRMTTTQTLSRKPSWKAGLSQHRASNHVPTCTHAHPSIVQVLGCCRRGCPHHEHFTASIPRSPFPPFPSLSLSLSLSLFFTRSPSGVLYSLLLFLFLLRAC